MNKELIEAARQFLRENNFVYSVESNIPRMIATFTAEQIQEALAAERAKIADKLEAINKLVAGHGQGWVYVQPLIDELRTKPESPLPDHADSGQTPGEPDTCVCGHSEGRHGFTNRDCKLCDCVDFELQEVKQ